ncbi:hypothetical protein ACFPME_06330 [Rhodanobacter umsongensis]|uniref:Uncharacterized protein n=1 Tax=Rhodanobacter umsongensis TaxID=633153 RepID=A0ABW0JJT9_9GAMM
MTRFLRTTALCSVTFAVLLLGACGKSEPAAPASAPTAPAPAATAMAPPPPSTVAAPASTSTSASMAPAGSVPAPPAAQAVAPLTVAKITLGSEVNAEHRVTRATARFAPNDKAIYASVATEGSSEGATLNAKWSYLEGTGQLVSSISQSIATDGPAITTFKVQNPDLWPVGKYKVEISLDGKSVAKQDFEISKS